MASVKKLEEAYEAASAEFTEANKAYLRALKDVDGDESKLSAETRLAFIDARAKVDDAYQALTAAQIDAANKGD